MLWIVRRRRSSVAKCPRLRNGCVCRCHSEVDSGTEARLESGSIEVESSFTACVHYHIVALVATIAVVYFHHHLVCAGSLVGVRRILRRARATVSERPRIGETNTCRLVHKVECGGDRTYCCFIGSKLCIGTKNGY